MIGKKKKTDKEIIAKKELNTELFAYSKYIEAYNFVKTFKPDLKKIRLAKGYTQQTLADSIGVTKSYISKVENGGSGLTADFLDKIIKLFLK